jgi:cohesin complex subunit SA-1/2
MSSSHTVTVVALEAEIALCDVAGIVHKESHVIARQREGGGNPQLDAKTKEVKQRQNKFKSFIKVFVDG